MPTCTMHEGCIQYMQDEYGAATVTTDTTARQQIQGRSGHAPVQLLAVVLSQVASVLLYEVAVH
jgi:hypothetical protein